MTDYDNTNRGSIWKNDKMRPDKQDPDFTGSLNVGGAEYYVSAWKRKPDASAKAPALSFTVKRKEKDAKPAPSRSGGSARLNDDMDDKIPFAPEFR